ncbi:YqaJ viral recombinase family protein [Leucobacter sp.]
MSAQVAEAYQSQVLVDLEACAGAPDTDRPAWLAERRGGITATEVRDLYMRKIGRKAYKEPQQLIDEKLERAEDTFSGNRYTDWGKEREPVIAARLERSEGFAPEARVFHHPENSRYLASPDGLGVDFDELLELLEIKTAGYDLPPGSEKYAEKGYEFQAQWQMFVLGARRVRFVVEERITEPDGSFSPGPEHRYWIDRDDELIARLVEVADEFLAEVDRQREEGAPKVDPALDELAADVLAGRAAESAGKSRKEAAWSALTAVLAEGGRYVSQASDRAKVTYTPGAVFVDEVVDLEAAAAAYPKETEQLKRAKARVEKLQAAWDALAVSHTKKVRAVGKPKLTVTAVKEKKA